MESENNLIKFVLGNTIREKKIKQEIVAKVMDVNQSTVSRMTNHESDLNLTVAQLHQLHSEPFTRPIADEVMAAIGARFNFVPGEAQVNGSIIDELIELVKVDGVLAHVVELSDPKKILQAADQLEDIAVRLRAEVKRRKQMKQHIACHAQPEAPAENSQKGGRLF